MARNLPAVHEIWETWVPSLGWEDPLEKEMATHSVFLSGKSSKVIQALRRIRFLAFAGLRFLFSFCAALST